MKRRDIDTDSLLTQAVLGLTPLFEGSPETGQIVAALHELAPLLLQGLIHGYGDVLLTIRNGQLEAAELRRSTRVRLHQRPIIPLSDIRRPRAGGRPGGAAR